MVSAAKSVPDRTDFHHQAQLEIELGSWPMTPGSLSPGLQTDRPNIRPQGPSWPRRKLFHTSRCCAKYRVSLLVSYDALQCGFPGGAGGQESACLRDAKRLGFDPWLGRSPGVGSGNPPNILAWEIPPAEEPGGLQSMGPQRVGHD